MQKFFRLVLLLLIAGVASWLIFPDKAAVVVDYVKLKASNKLTINERLEQFGAAATSRLAPHFQQAGIPFPPTAISLLAFKDSKRLELYARHPQGAWQWVRNYPIQAASGVLGPKLVAAYVPPASLPTWVETLYPNLKVELENYPRI